MSLKANIKRSLLLLILIAFGLSGTPSFAGGQTTLQEAYPNMGFSVLRFAKLADLPKKTVLRAEDIVIDESQILRIIDVAGITLILLFAIGYCLPIVDAGSSAAMVKGVLEDSRWQGATQWFRKGAGVIIIGLAAGYFIVNPFASA